MTINECGEICGTRIYKGNLNARRNVAQCHFVHRMLHITSPGIQPEPQPLLSE
jgi:demethoxyubiquinone hydroxylase (CLK1/Coq7/Cat5 family)